MHVAMYYSNSDVRTDDVPRPSIGRGELLLKVMASGICGSDVMEWYRKKGAPKVIGHEISGEIAEIGSGVDGFIKGDRVAAIHKVPCNTCSHCLKGHHTSCNTCRSTGFDPGGFSEYVRLPEINVDRGVFRLPDNVSFEEGTFAEPLGCAVRAQGIAGVSPGDSVLVMGSGIAGLLNIRLAIARGAARVFATDINDYRLGFAEKSGAEAIRADDDVASRLRELNKGRLADKVMVCTGAVAAARQALGLVERGGTILFFAVPPPGDDLSFPMNDFWVNEIKTMTSYYASPADVRDSLALISSGRVHVKDLITHRLPLEKAGKGFSLVAGAGESVKVVILPHG